MKVKNTVKGRLLLTELKAKFSISPEFSVKQMQVEGSVEEQFSHLFFSHTRI